MKIKLNIIRNTFIFAFTACVICAVLCFNNGFKENTVYAQENLQEAAVLASGACGTGLTWNLTDDGTLRIEGEGAMSTYSNGTAPWYSYADNITAIIISDTVTSISSSAFYGCDSLQEITLPFVGASRTITTSTSAASANGRSGLFGYIFGWYTRSWTSTSSPSGTTKQFWDGDAMIKELNLNDSIAQIDDYAFYDCNTMDTFKLPSELTVLGDFTMYNCDAITDMEIPIGITNVPQCTFYRCDELVNIKLHSDITKIGDNAFYDCVKLENVDLPEKLETIGNGAFYNNKGFSEITIPDSVTTISSYAFYGCNNVRFLHIGSNVQSIGLYAFAYIDDITNIIVPNSVTSIENDAFHGCDSLQEITLPFVGASRTITTSTSAASANGRSGLFGYIFGWYTRSWTSTSSPSGTTKQFWDGDRCIL